MTETVTPLADAPPTLAALLAALQVIRSGVEDGLHEAEAVIDRYEATRDTSGLPRLTWGIQFCRPDGSDAGRRDHLVSYRRAKQVLAGSKRNGLNVVLLPMIETLPSSLPKAAAAPPALHTVHERLRELSARASQDWAMGRFATLHGGPVQHFERGSAQTQIACFTAPRRDLDDTRETADEQQANADLALECVRFVRDLLAG